MTDRQIDWLLACARQLVARTRELRESRACTGGRRDAADLYGVGRIRDAFRRLAECMADKGLTLAEKVELANEYRRRAGERRGRPRRGAPKKRKINQGIGGFPWCPLRPGMRLDDGAAAVAGFRNREEARLARVVVERGGPGLAAKVDRGEVSLFEAARLAREKAEAVPG